MTYAIIIALAVAAYYPGARLLLRTVEAFWTFAGAQFADADGQLRTHTEDL